MALENSEQLGLQWQTEWLCAQWDGSGPEVSTLHLLPEA
jgi:hypothetical protein